MRITENPAREATLGGVVRAMGAVFLGFSLLSLASGALFALIGVRLSAAGVTSTLIGAIMSAYFVGLLAGSLSGDRIISRVGHIRAFAVFAAIASVSILLLAMTDDLPAWVILRAVGGYCMAGLFMTVESWLNHRAHNLVRGRTFAIYAVLSGGAIASGPLLLNVGDPAGFELFSVTAMLFAAALVPVALTRTGNPEITPGSRLGLRRLFQVSPLGVVGCLTAGLVNSSFYGMGAVYGEAVGLSPALVSLFLTLTLVGGLVAQFPVGAVSDRIDRRRLMLGLTIVAATAAVAIALFGSLAPAVLLALGFLMDAAAHPLYSLSVAQTNDYVERAEFVPASRGLLLAYASGASLGPTVASLCMEAIGPAGLFAYIATILTLLAAFILYRMARRQAKPIEAQGPLVKMPQATPVAAELDPRAPEGKHTAREEPD
ncbi:MAG: MFS transporter [Dongiaceae bacterium]